MKQFFVSFFATLTALLVVLAAPVLLIIILLLAAATNPAAQTVAIANNSILVLDLNADLVDSPLHATPTDPFTSLLSSNASPAIQLREVTNALKKAALDKRIVGIFLHGSLSSGGFAQVKELREAILAFSRKSKKPVIAYCEVPSNKDYYLATAADTIYLNPYGELETPGLAREGMYFLNAFQKFGIDVEVTKHGRYKSAVEPFIRSSASAEDKEQTYQLLQGIWNEFVQTVAASRKIDPDSFQQLVDTEGMIKPTSALAAHLVDHLAYLGDVLTKLGELAPSNNDNVPFQQVSYNQYVNSGMVQAQKIFEGKHFSSGSDAVGVLYLEGDIVDGQGDDSSIGGDRYASELRELQRDDHIRAVVLRVNSPGGSVFGSQQIAREISNLEEKKPVVVSMGTYAASGGYWISAPARRIFAEPNTVTGSIGVFGLYLDYKKAADSLGITFDTTKVGHFADLGTPSRPLNPDEMNLLQSSVEDIYDKFIAHVATHRHISPDQVRAIAEGRVWSGKDALGLKLVDELGGLDQAIQSAAQLADLGSRPRVEEFPSTPNFWLQLAQVMNGEEEPLSRLLTHVRGARLDQLSQGLFQTQSLLKVFRNFNDRTNTYARLPLSFELND